MAYMKAFFAGVLLTAAIAAGAQERVALVIGNSHYASAPLVNPTNDARAMAERLRELGFKVVEREDLTVKQISPTLREFRSGLAPGSVALIFYAGHGLQIKGTNYLPAVDADIVSEEDVALQSIDVNKLLDMLGDSKTRLNLLFLDACRNNPYARSMRSGVNGLAKVDAPSGTLISFATRPGSTASDGSGGHGLYTEKLLRVMGEPGLPIEQVLKRVGTEVKKATRGAQEPWMEGSIEGEFYFRGGGASATTVGDVQKVDPAAIELAFWDSIKSSANKRDYELYLEKYPQGQFSALAKERSITPPAPQVAAADRAQVAYAGNPGKIKVAIVGFENKSTYGADKLSDTSGQLLYSKLFDMDVFRMVEWEQMKRLFTWQELSTNKLVESPQSMANARKILLTEFFLSGAVTEFDVKQTSEVSAMSKRKIYTTNVRVDLKLQNAATGEFLAGGTGRATKKQEFSGDITGGQTGSWDPQSGDQALDEAIQEAIQKMLERYKRNAT